MISCKGRVMTPRRKSSIAVQSPRLKTQQLFAINREKLLLFGGQRFAIEASIEIAVQFDRRNLLIPVSVPRNLLFVQRLQSSNPVSTLAGSMNTENRWVNGTWHGQWFFISLACYRSLLAASVS
jgi:hypothetical protein